MLRLQLQQARARRDEENNPRNAFGDSQIRMEQLGCAETEQDGGEQVRRRADHEIPNAGEDSAEGPDEVLRGAIRRRKIAPRNPRRQIFWVVGNEREKEQRSDAEQNEGEDFVPGAVFSCASHRASQ